jgi:hypothetical protein
MFTAIRRDRRRYGSVAGQSLFNPEASLFPEPRELSLQLRRPCDKGSDAEKDGEVRLPARRQNDSGQCREEREHPDEGFPSCIFGELAQHTPPRKKCRE